MIKTFRGRLDTDTQEQIRLSTIKGKIGYRIAKFELMQYKPGAVADVEGVIKIYKSTQTTFNATVDFTDSDLLAAGFFHGSTSTSNPSGFWIIFDQEIFNQDIYVTYVATAGTMQSNYYIELEVIPLDDAGAEYTTLKDMRQG